MDKDQKRKVVAFIPARSGSKRLPDKNVKLLAGHPLIAYTICAARESGIFDSIIVSTDSEAYAEIARKYGAEVPFLRPADIAGDKSPDFEWIEFTLSELKQNGRNFDCFSILRPTSPFRLPDTICRAWQKFLSVPGADSLRAVEKCKQHPGKMWVVGDKVMTPLLPFKLDSQPWHSNQYQALPEVYVQNASLEIAKTSVITEDGNISGSVVVPFITDDNEGFDVNHPEDWDRAELLVAKKNAVLPSVSSI